MKSKSNPSICYMAGLVAHSSKREKNLVAIQTSINEIEQKFIEIAIKEFEIMPEKILIKEMEGNREVAFYHSRVAKQLKEVYSRETHLFKKRDKLASAYVAGLFDNSGRVSRQGAVTITPISPEDAFMLENLGIHTRGTTVLNIGNLISLIKDESILIQRITK